MIGKSRPVPQSGAGIDPDLLERIGSAAQICFGEKAPLEELAKTLERIAAEKGRTGDTKIIDGDTKPNGGDTKKTVRELLALETILPDFSAEQAVKDPDFIAAMRRTGSAVEAIAAVMPQNKVKERKAIAQNGQSATRGSGDSSGDPSRFGSKEFMRYINGIRNN